MTHKELSDRYLSLKLPKSIGGAKTVGDLASRGCPKCGKPLFPAGSTGFGSLHCVKHGCIWDWIPTKRERDGYAPTAWKNRVTGEMSQEWRKRWFRRE